MIDIQTVRKSFPMITELALQEAIAESGELHEFKAGNIIIWFVVGYAALYFSLFAFAIFVLKRTDDMIQGISKLDYLAKISIF